MELIKGGELGEKIIKKKIFSEEKLRKIIKMILEAILHLNSLNIMHRDIKPSNILFRENSDSIVLIDYGLATFLKENDVIFRKCGTESYIAPEIIQFSVIKN